jgi:hypothetical protein
MKTSKTLNVVLVFFCMVMLGFVILSSKLYDNYEIQQFELDNQNPKPSLIIE